MKKTSCFILLATALFALSACGGGHGAEDSYVDGDKLAISLRNVYFESWAGGDVYTEEIENRFKVKLIPSSYSYNDWNTQVVGAVNGNNLTDVFNYNVTQFNFADSYQFWAEGKVIKALPDDLSAWPNLKKLIEGLTNINSLKIDGHLYGIPIAKNIAKDKVDYSPFTYLYRRDWAKEWGVYKENDVYTYEEFTALIKEFNRRLNPDGNGDHFAMADVEWGFPSITNFYKDSPHCFSFDEAQNKYVGTFATDSYLDGLDLAKTYQVAKIYGYDQYNASEGGARKAYISSNCGVFYENLSYSNYQEIRDKMEIANTGDPNFKLDDATAIMKVKGPDGKFALEGTDNWFSMTLFNADISDNKMNKVLDIIDFLLSEEGTRLAVYGLKDYDYKIDEDGNISLTSKGWKKEDPDDPNSKYVEKTNGAKYLRFMATLGNDYLSVDPFTDKRTAAILDAWDQEMDQANKAHELRVFKEREEVMWLSTPLKDFYEGQLLSKANEAVIQYCYEKIDKSAFIGRVTSNDWVNVLDEINRTLGYTQ